MSIRPRTGLPAAAAAETRSLSPGDLAEIFPGADAAGPFEGEPAAAEIRRIRAAYPETVMRPVAAIDGDFREMQVVRALNEPGHEVLTWLKRAAYHLTNRADHHTGMVVAGDAHWWHVSLFERAVGHHDVEPPRDPLPQPCAVRRERDPQRVVRL